MKLIPQRWAERLRRLTALHVALLISFGVHAVLLTVRSVDPEGFNRVFKDTPLEVILVNARSSEPPLKAQAIAQAALAGLATRCVIAWEFVTYRRSVPPGSTARDVAMALASTEHRTRNRSQSRYDAVHVCE